MPAESAREQRNLNRPPTWRCAIVTLMRAGTRANRSPAQSGLLWRHLVGGYSLGRSYWLHIVGTLVRDSPGGRLKEGIRMADVVKRYRLNTRVEKQCFSASMLVLLAGENRSAADRALIGFHRGRAIGEAQHEVTHPAAKEEADIYVNAGLRSAFVARIVSTPNDSILIPSRRELLHEDVVTR